jgi:Transposase DDE domain
MAKQTLTEVRQNLLDQLDWQMAERDDKRVAALLYAGEKADAVHTLDEAGLLDEFFAFLEESGVLSLWKAYEISGIQRVFIPTIYFLLLYGSRLLFGINAMNALPVLLFSNVAVMTLIGFNGRLVQEGLSERGKKQRTDVRPYVLMDPQTVAATICKSSVAELEKLFNGTIQALATFGLFMAEMMVAIDGSQIVTTEHFRGRGCQRVSEWRTTRTGIKVEVIRLVYGWRLIALLDLTTLIPVAIKIVQIQAGESPHLIELVKQAQVNLAPYSRIVTLVADRAYLDGADLYFLDQMNIRFVVIAKTNMAAYGTALCKSVETDTYYDRTETVQHGQGRDQTSETLLTRLQTVTDIRTWDSYRPPPIADKQLRIADRPALNAVLVRLWQNKTPESPRIFLTNQAVENPWLIFDLYDDRSWIENGLFRNTKQFWQLSRWFPQRNAAGVYTHLTFVMLITAAATAFRLWGKAHSPQTTLAQLPQRKFTFQTVQHTTGLIALTPLPQPPPTHLAVTASPPDDPSLYSHHLWAGIGPARWRQDLKRLNRDKLIVFFGLTYGIFDLPVFLSLTGVPFHLPPDAGTLDDILARYQILQE